MGPCISSHVFKPPRLRWPYDTKDMRGRTFVKLRTKHGSEIMTCHIVPEGTRYNRTVIYAHGNASDITASIQFAQDFMCAHLRANFLVFSYSGYPLCTGSPSEQHVLNDADAVYEYARDRLGLRNRSIILMGHSLGAAPAIHVANKYELDESGDANPFMAVALVSAFTSIYRVRFKFRHTYIGDMFPNIDRITQVASPTLVVVGDDDQVVPQWHSDDLYNAARARYKRLVVIPGGGHNSVMTGDADVLRAINDFVESNMRASEAHRLI
jgi:fermentation-respiration switch protein FrsA (DUF1100 family)